MELRPYQKRIANWLCQHPHACLSVGMGLGKTAAVLHFLDYTRQLYPHATALIVAPKRVAETVWMQEAEKWELWPLRSNMLLVNSKNKQDADSTAPVKIVSRDNVGLFADKHFDILVMDELTSFKNLRSQRTKSVLSINADRRIGLTGTFAPNGLLDTYAQLAACGIASANEGDYYAWRGRWFVNVNQGRAVAFPLWKLRNFEITQCDVCLPTLTGYPCDKGFDGGCDMPKFRRPATQKEITEKALAPYLQDIITLTTEDYLQLPKMQTRTISVELSKEERKAYDDLVATLHFSLPDGLDDFTVSEKARFAKVQTLCSGFVYDRDGDYSEDGVVRIKGGGAKIADAVEFCSRAAGEGESVLLFYNYRETALWLGEELTKAGLRFASVKGSNLDWLAKWNAGELDVLVANPASAGHGLNLQQGGHIVLWLELTYNYEYYAQANARLHRTGQRYPVQVWHLVAKDTVDEGVLRLLQNKDKTNKRVEAATKRA